jgi:hypothetical protein
MNKTQTSQLRFRECNLGRIEGIPVTLPHHIRRVVDPRLADYHANCLPEFNATDDVVGFLNCQISNSSMHPEFALVISHNYTKTEHPESSDFEITETCHTLRSYQNEFGLSPTAMAQPSPEREAIQWMCH